MSFASWNQSVLNSFCHQPVHVILLVENTVFRFFGIGYAFNLGGVSCCLFLSCALAGILSLIPLLFGIPPTYLGDWSFNGLLHFPEAVICFFFLIGCRDFGSFPRGKEGDTYLTLPSSK